MLLFLTLDTTTQIGDLSGAGEFHVSSHRLLWIPHGARQGVCLPLEMLTSLKIVSSGIFGMTQKLEALSTGNQKVLFAFKHKNDIESMFSHASAALQARQAFIQQQQQQQLQQQQQQTVFSPKSAGISGVLLNVQSQARQRDESLTQAFSDLKALMDNAKQMVEIAQRLARSEDASASAPDGAVVDQYLMSVGLQSPVTKKSSGTAFHQQLARQLCDFLQRPLAEHGGVLSLPDVFCLYNRARGTDLVSPDDLVRACNLFAPLELPLRFCKLPSGVLVVQSPDHSQEAVAQKLRAMASAGPLTAFQVARQTKCTITLAQEQLLASEELGFLCRDQSIEGLLFYPNLFPTF